jgi:esterase/lipase superfamily enzyme
MEYGIVKVSLPARYRVGETAGPRWWKLEFQPDPTRHVVATGIDRMARDRFTKELRAAIGADSEGELLVFIHGYNVSFPDAARRAAQIARDLKFGGQTAVYSWPSKARTLLYSADEATIEASIPNLEEFLDLLLRNTGARRMHIVAHSMGSRALAYALQKFRTTALPNGSAGLGHVIFAAPDVDRTVFARCGTAFRGCAERFTLYASSSDLALRVSKLLHRFPRAGDADALVVQDGLDTVDASGADTSLFGLGHSYFANKRSILNDMFGAIQNGLSPNERFDLTMADSPDGSYWLYRT